MNEQKEIDLSRTLYDLVEENPELIAVFQEVGLSGVSNPVMRKTAGRTVTILEGIARHKLSLEKVVKTLAQKGYRVKTGGSK